MSRNPMSSLFDLPIRYMYISNDLAFCAYANSPVQFVVATFPYCQKTTDASTDRPEQHKIVIENKNNSRSESNCLCK